MNDIYEDISNEIIGYLKDGLNRREISKKVYRRVFIRTRDQDETHKVFNSLLSRALMKIKKEEGDEKERKISEFKTTDKYHKISHMEKIYIG